MNEEGCMTATNITKECRYSHAGASRTVEHPLHGTSRPYSGPTNTSKAFPLPYVNKLLICSWCPTGMQAGTSWRHTSLL